MTARLATCLFLVSACIDPSAEVDVTTADQALCYGSEPGDCLPPPQPLEAPAVFLTARTTTSVSTQYQHAATYTQTKLQHRVPGGAWTTLTTSTTTGTRTFLHGSRPNDSVNCYRVWATNGTESAYSDEKCALTRTPNDVPISRLQLRAVVADVAYAGTTDRVGVSLSTNRLPGYNHTGLDYAPLALHGMGSDDFARNREFAFDLDMETSWGRPDGTVAYGAIATLRDIGEIRIAKYGDDALCLERIELIVNGRVAFTKAFGTTSTTCRWLDHDTGYSPVLAIPFSELRAATSFTGFESPTPPIQACTEGVCLVIPRLELVQRLEGAIGDMIWVSDQVYWGQIYNGAGVEMVRVDADTVHVDLDLAGSIDWVADPEVDVDFDIDVAFAPADGGGYDLLFNVVNFDVSVDFNLFTEVVGWLITPFCAPAVGALDCVSAIEERISTIAERGFTVQSTRIPFAVADACSSPPTVTVDSDASLRLSCIPDLSRLAGVR